MTRGWGGGRRRGGGGRGQLENSGGEGEGEGDELLGCGWLDRGGGVGATFRLVSALRKNGVRLWTLQGQDGDARPTDSYRVLLAAAGLPRLKVL